MKNKIDDKNNTEFLTEYKRCVEQNKSKSQDDFEKYINLWSSGGIIITLMILSKLVEFEIEIVYKFLFVIGLISFLLTILSNLISHNNSIKDSDFVLSNCSSYENLFEKTFQEKLNKRNRFITVLNDFSIYSFIVGLLSILTAVIINFYIYE